MNNLLTPNRPRASFSELVLLLCLILMPAFILAQTGCPNLIANGNFQAGNTGFTSGLPLGCNSCTANTYCVTNNFTGKCSGWPSVFDHTTGTAAGRFMAIDGSTAAATDVWSVAGIPVTPGVTYEFSFWVATVFGPGQQVFDLGMRINGQTVAVRNISQPLGVWTRYSTTWVCPVSLFSVPIAIRQMTPGAFRDFGLDDIGFSCTSCTADFSFEVLGPCGAVQFINQSNGQQPHSSQWSFGDPNSGANNNSTQASPSHQFSACGTFNVCLTFSAATGCSDIICKPVTITDNIPPVAICALGEGYELNANCTLPVTIGMIDAGSFDNCQIQSMSVSPAVVQGCGVFPITLTVTDWCGNTSTCSTEIQTIEVVPPVITCPPNVQRNCNTNLTPAFTGFATATDNCMPAPTITWSDAVVGQMPCDGAVIRTWTATDDCGNESTCVQTITVIDNVPPVVACRSNLSVVLGANCSVTVTPAMIDNGSSDNCQIQSMTVNPNTFTQCGTFTVTLTVTDVCGNTATCTTNVQVSENVPPVIVCPPNVQLTCGGPTSPAATGFASATDNCSIPLVTFTNVVTGSQPCDQLIVRTWSAEDDCGNTATCVQTIRVMDNIPPVAVCRSSLSVALGANCSVTVTPEMIDNGSSDNCEIQSMTVNPNTFTQCGTFTVTLTVTDVCGNTATCTTNVQVSENVTPVIVCPPNVQLTCGGPTSPAATGFASATDNCSTPLVTFTDVVTGSQPCDQLIVRTWRATDNCGNTATCVQTIRVMDNVPPVLTNCPQNITVMGTIGPNGNCTASVQVTSPTATDICDPAVILTNSFNGTANASGTYPQGTTTVTWTATDHCGNVETCSFVVTVECMPQPELNISCGMAVATCFSGYHAPTNTVVNNAPVIALFDVRDASTAPLGLAWHSQYSSTPPAKQMFVEGDAIHCGQVFGLAIDMNGCILTTSSTIYGDASNLNGFTWTAAGPGAIFRFYYSAGVWVRELFAVLPNAGSGLGNITYDKINDQFFVTNFHDGRIYRILNTPCGSGPTVPQSSFLHSGGTSIPVPLNPDFVPLGQRLWGVGFNHKDGRVYFARWNEDNARNSPTVFNEIWSIALTTTGDFDFSTPEVLEITIPNFQNTNYSNPVSDIEFSENGDMLVAEKVMRDDIGDAKTLNGTLAHRARIFQYRGTTGNWGAPQEIFIGNANSNQNSAGGTDYGYNDLDANSQLIGCDERIWGSGDALMFNGHNDFNFSTDLVYGIAAMLSTGNTAPSSPVSTWVEAQSIYVDLDGNLTNNEKLQIGDVDIYNCPCPTLQDSCICHRDLTIIHGSDSISTACTSILYGFPCPVEDVTISGFLGCFNSVTGLPCPPTTVSWTLGRPGGLTTISGSDANFQFVTFPAADINEPGIYSLTLWTICPGSTEPCICRISWIQEDCGDTCICIDPALMTLTSGNSSFTVDCASGAMPVLPCPPSPVTITGNFGCINPITGGDCTDVVNWELTRPNGLPSFFGSSTVSAISQTFSVSDISTPGVYSFEMTTLCNNQADTCICLIQWIQEGPCPDSCVCGPDPFDMEIRFGGGLNTPVHCGDVITLPANGFFVLYTSFQCQGNNCPPTAQVDWVLTGPPGFATQNSPSPLTATPGFVIPPLSSANFTIPGTYTLTMTGHCGAEDCPCVVTFCLPPPPPFVNDTAVCRTNTTAYIPLEDCPDTCGITQVRWFVKPCSALVWPTTPYQISSGPGCADLLLLPYQYPGETCVQVYSEVTLDGRCCSTTLLTSNIATVTLCDPVSCIINNPNPSFCQSGNPAALQVSFPSAPPCSYTVQWYNQGVLINGATNLSYQPPMLDFPSNLPSSVCYYDYEFSVILTGPCGPSTCATTIRVYNDNADAGQIDMIPFESQPFCPGEDATLVYSPACAELPSGPPPTWTWWSSIVSANTGFVQIPGSGTMDPVINTNKLFNTTWYKVIKQNGACLADEIVYQIVVKNPLVITNFTAVPDPCADTQVVLTVDFTPTPITGTDTDTGAPCQYVIDWYHNGNLIRTTNSAMSSVSWTYQPTPGTGSVAGVYYAVVRDNCCPQSVQTVPIVIDPTCVPAIVGPCFRCNNDTMSITLTGVMVLPPKDPCPDICTYQWYDETTGNPILIAGATNATYTSPTAGKFIFESNCNGCIRRAVHEVVQCGPCTVSVNDLVAGVQVKIYPNPTTGDMTVQVSPSPLHNGTVRVVDVNGRVLVSEKIPDGQEKHTLSLAHLPTGLYFVQVFENGILVWVDKIVRDQ